MPTPKALSDGNHWPARRRHAERVNSAKRHVTFSGHAILREASAPAGWPGALMGPDAVAVRKAQFATERHAHLQKTSQGSTLRTCLPMFGIGRCSMHEGEMQGSMGESVVPRRNARRPCLGLQAPQGPKSASRWRPLPSAPLHTSVGTRARSAVGNGDATSQTPMRSQRKISPSVCRRGAGLTSPSLRGAKRAAHVRAAWAHVLAAVSILERHLPRHPEGIRK